MTLRTATSRSAKANTYCAQHKVDVSAGNGQAGTAPDSRWIILVWIIVVIFNFKFYDIKKLNIINVFIYVGVVHPSISPPSSPSHIPRLAAYIRRRFLIRTWALCALSSSSRSRYALLFSALLTLLASALVDCSSYIYKASEFSLANIIYINCKLKFLKIFLYIWKIYNKLW